MEDDGSSPLVAFAYPGRYVRVSQNGGTLDRDIRDAEVYKDIMIPPMEALQGSFRNSHIPQVTGTVPACCTSVTAWFVSKVCGSQPESSWCRVVARVQRLPLSIFALILPGHIILPVYN